MPTAIVEGFQSSSSTNAKCLSRTLSQFSVIRSVAAVMGVRKKTKMNNRTILLRNHIITDGLCSSSNLTGRRAEQIAAIGRIGTPPELNRVKTTLKNSTLGR
jgi:hypothetical protein